MNKLSHPYSSGGRVFVMNQCGRGQWFDWELIIDKNCR